MKKTILTAIAAFGMMQIAEAQVIDTVITGNGYVNNIWYSLENDNQASQPANNWDIAVATTINPQSGIASGALFNYKIGKLYAIPGSNPANFETVDTTGIAASGELFNSDTSWSKGAFNNTPSLGTFDYGWGTYNFTTHSGIAANRIFVVKYNDGSFKKLVIDLSFSTGYTIKSSNLDNSSLQIKVIPLETYASKNFIYYKVETDAVIDREPATANWDLTFAQYYTQVMGTMYPVAGILQNPSIEVAKVHPLDNPATFTDWSLQNFTNHINGIGYNWKNSGPSGIIIADSTVYFVKSKTGDLWKVIMTGFITGSGPVSTGEYIFSKQKMATASLNEMESNATMLVYPNPANDMATLVIDNQTESNIAIYNTLGKVVYTTTVTGNGLQTVIVPVATLNSGIYHVVCNANGQSINQKLMIQH